MRQFFGSVVGSLVPVLIVAVLVVPVLMVLICLGLGFVLSPVLSEGFRGWLLNVMSELGTWLANAAKSKVR
jgi:hypothetical protein